MSSFAELDVVSYDTGKTYIIFGLVGPQTLQVNGWKNGKPFGATRFVDPARCTKIGEAVRPQERGDSWGFTPAN